MQSYRPNSKRIHIYRNDHCMRIEYQHYKVIINLESEDEDDISFCVATAQNYDKSPIYDKPISYEPENANREDNEALELMLESARDHLLKRKVFSPQLNNISRMLEILESSKTFQSP